MVYLYNTNMRGLRILAIISIIFLLYPPGLLLLFKILIEPEIASKYAKLFLGKSFFELQNLFIFISAGLISIKFYQSKKYEWCFLFFTIAIYFNPIYLFEVELVTGMITSILSAAAFLVSFFLLKSKIFQAKE